MFPTTLPTPTPSHRDSLLNSKPPSGLSGRLNSLLVRAIGNVANHPFEYGKLLIQLGYEPFPPVPGRYLTKRVLYYPNLLQYVSYIKSVDGLVGLYRGLGPRLLANSLHYAVSSMLMDLSPVRREQETAESGTTWLFSARSEPEYYAKQTGWEVVSVSAAVLVSHPLHVITVRMMGAFVGREVGANGSLLSTLATVLREEGLAGLFRGLLPRLLGEGLCVVITAAVVYAMRRSFSKDAMPGYVAGLVGSYTANSLTYQFALTSNVMIVNGSSLAVGRPPFTPLYTGWVDGWGRLGRDRQLGRGASMFGRLYTGRVVEGRPVDVFVGPVHPRRLH